MRDEIVNDENREEAADELDRHSRSRRRLLRGMVAATGASLAAEAIPSKWVPPVLNSALLPVEGQTISNPGTIQGYVRIFDDSADEANDDPENSVDFGPCLDWDFPRATDSDTFPSDAGDAGGVQFRFYGTVDPPSDGVAVSVDITSSLDADAFSDDVEPDLPSDANSDSGAFAFNPRVASDVDFGDSSHSGDITVTFHATGYDDCVVTINTFPDED